jgi:hypothetical protein
MACMGRREMHTGIWCGNLKKRGHLEELDEGITSKWVMKNRMRGCRLDSSSSQCQVTGCCENSNDSRCSVHSHWSVASTECVL